MIHRPSKIVVRGAFEHNLKNIDVSVPRNQLTVVTGVSGSGKSSLAFDTILAESNRRFFQTLSHYSRQFLDVGDRPLLRSISGLSPAIGLSQKETRPSPLATVASQTDVSELMGVLYSKFGQKMCPEHQLSTTGLEASTLITTVFNRYEGEFLAICAPVVEQKKGAHKTKLDQFRRKGFVKLVINGELRSLNEDLVLDKSKKHTIKLILDFVHVVDKTRSRLKRSIDQALVQGAGMLELYRCGAKGELDGSSLDRLSTLDGCPNCHFSWPKLDPRYFSANSLGRCSSCQGRGEEYDEELSLNQFECASCSGTGLSQEFEPILWKGRPLKAYYQMSLKDLSFLTSQWLSSEVNEAIRLVLIEILFRLQKIEGIGLGYLCLKRRLRSLSSGEFQRLRLASILSESLRGVIYVLDEPSQGLHPQELAVLLENLRLLTSRGNTVILVDHDEYLMDHADWIIDLGPGGGSQGGQVCAEFRPVDAYNYKAKSATAKFMHERSVKKLDQKADILVAQKLLDDDSGFIELTQLERHNLNIESLRFKKSALNVICGVSGAGKSTLLMEELVPRVRAFLASKSTQRDKGKEANFDQAPFRPNNIDDITGLDVIDRQPLAKSGVSMPVTYLDVYTEIRLLYQAHPTAQVYGFNSRAFSLQVEGGRCPSCKGKGVVILKTRFLSDASVKCSSCNGRRFKDSVLSIKYSNKSIADVLEMTIDESIEHFQNHKKIIQKLKAASRLGLGYLRLGQPSSSLSGGEAQRLKLAPYLVQNKKSRFGARGNKRLVVLDEPTQGLHFKDIELLLDSLKALIQQGMTIVVIEHNQQLIKASHWIVDLGPGAAEEGGQLVYQGWTHQFLDCSQSVTAKFLLS